MISAGALLAGCASDSPHQARFGSFSGQVLVSGPLRSAAVSVDQIETKDPAMGIRHHVADTTTDDHGAFTVDPGLYSGLLLVTTSGGAFDDTVTGTTIQLDANAGIEAIVPFQPLDTTDDVLISPVGALIAARTRFKAAGEFRGDPEPVAAAQKDASQRLGNHFGNVKEWTLLKIASLADPATSPTEPVRAALVHAALSFLAHDIAAAAGASPQEVNVLSLTKQLAADIGQGPFDGNDSNSLDFSLGLKVGVCPPVTGCSAPPAGECALGACRPLCDLYSGTARGLLSNEMTKVIRSPDLNHTGLHTADVLAVARSMSDNVDDDLFGSACLEQLDRIPPSLSWTPSTPTEDSFVRGTTMLKVTAFDDLDPLPKVRFLNYVDADGDPTNSVAIAAIDTTSEMEGPLSVIAQATDMAGNIAMITRVIQIDNTAPVLTLDRPVGVVDDGTTWWTSNAAPVLSGTLTEAHPAGVEAVIGSMHIPGTITGSTWSVTVPAGTLDLAGADVHIVVTDAAGNQCTVVQHVRYDATPPAVSLLVSSVHDEASETPTFSSSPGSPTTDEVPSHVHGGPTVDLSLTGMCPSITKYSYLLGANPPPYGTEPNGRNPLRYQLLAADDGIGIEPAATQYRVGRDDASGATQWITAFISAGTGTPVPGNPGVTGYNVPIYADAVPGLDTLEGLYHVQFQSTDRLGRTTTEARCFNLHLRAPPLHLGALTVGTVTYVPGNAQGHLFAMQSLSLAPGAPFNQIATRVLNQSAASSLLDMPVINGTASTVYLTVNVTKPGSVTVSQSFSLRFLETITDLPGVNCDTHRSDPDCQNAPVFPPHYDGGDNPPVSGLVFPVRVYLLNTAGVPTTQIPCFGGCQDTDSTFQFALPPRGPGAAPLRFLVMSVVGQINALWPRDVNSPAAVPFSDFTVRGTHVTGSSSTSGGCSRFISRVGVLTCTQDTTFVAYRALTSINLTIGGNPEFLFNTYGTAATPAIPPVDAWGGSLHTTQGYTWNTAIDAALLPGP